MKTKSKNLKTFFATELNPNQRVQKNLTNPTPGKEIIHPNPTFNAPDFFDYNNPSQPEEEISLDIDEVFYKKIEWKREEKPQVLLDSAKNQHEEKEQTPPTQTTASINLSLNENIQSISQEKKKEPSLKNFTKDLSESLKKLDMILAKKSDPKTKNIKTENLDATKINQKSSNFNIETKKNNEKINDKEEFKTNISNKMHPNDSNNTFNNENNEELHNTIINSGKFETSQQMEKIIEEAHNQLFDPNYLSEVDPTTYTNPLFLIGT